MAVPTVRSSPSTTVGNGVTEVAITKPPGLADGDVVVLILSWEDTDPGTVTPPSGFTGAYLTTGTPRVPIYRAWKHVTNAAGEPANYTPSWENSHKVNAIGMAVVGADTTSPINAEGFNDDGANDTTATLDGVTTTVDDCLLIEIYVSETANRTITTGPSGGSSLGVVSQGGAGADVATAWWSDSQITAGATGNQDATWSGNVQGTNGILAIAPGAAGAISINLTPASLSLTAQVLTPLSLVAIQLIPAGLNIAAQALDPTIAGVDIDLTPADLTLTAQALSPTLGAASIDLTAASLTLTAQALQPLAAVAIALTPASLTITAQALQPTGGSVAILLTPAGLTLTAEPLSVVLAATSIDLTPAVLSLTASVLQPPSAPSTLRSGIAVVGLQMAGR